MDIKLFLLVSCAQFCCLTSFSQQFIQEVIGNAGGTYEQSYGSLQYNIGETLTETYVESEKAQIYEGFEQGSYSILDIQENQYGSISSRIFPNPSSHHVMIEIDAEKYQNFQLTLCDAQGRIILKRDKLELFDSIDVSNLNTGSYFLSIEGLDNSYMKKSKIIKQ